GPFRLIGRTTRGAEEARAAEEAGADYVAVGRLFESRTKPSAPFVGLPALKAVRAAVSIPVVGIGGVDASNVSSVYEAGADAAAAAGAVDELLASATQSASA
ncbi:MAG: thiamine phosphate synthase, partial [Elusimicrobia bacterium]|nr:thiamine phosphate synthase [Elusimicrobiota bacterium]